MAFAHAENVALPSLPPLSFSLPSFYHQAPLAGPSVFSLALAHFRGQRKQRHKTRTRRGRREGGGGEDPSRENKQAREGGGQARRRGEAKRMEADASN